MGDAAADTELCSRIARDLGVVVRPHAATARRGDLAGLPPAWIGVGDLDLFHAEDVEYARRPAEAGVACGLHVEEGMFHGADILFQARSAVARGVRDRVVEALGQRIGGATARR